MSGLCMTPIIQMQQRLAKGMNIIEAHRIVHDYVDVVAQGTGEFSLAFRDCRLLKDDPWKIQDAYFVFYGHMILYNTRTQEEYEAYDMCLKMISYFVSGYRYDEIVETEKYLKTHKKNLLNKNKYEKAEKERNDYLKILFDPVSNAIYGSIYGTIQEFFNQAQSLKSDLMVSMERGELLPEEVKHIYCNTLFNEKTITLGADGEELFEPFEVLQLILREGAENGMDISLYEKHRDYIMNNF